MSGSGDRPAAETAAGGKADKSRALPIAANLLGRLAANSLHRAADSQGSHARTDF